MMLDARQRAMRYHNENGFLANPMELHNDTMLKANFWLPHEKELFKERYLVHPKSFGYIADAFDNKVSVQLPVGIMHTSGN